MNFQVLGAQTPWARILKDFKGFEAPRLAQIEIWKEFIKVFGDFRSLPEAPRALSLLIPLNFLDFLEFPAFLLKITFDFGTPIFFTF